jgi:uncharacterized coiled-coil protein SlyX
MKPESIIVNLSGVVAKQNQMLNEAQSSIEYLREYNERLQELSTKQQKEIEAQNSLVAEQSVKIANLQNEIEKLNNR